MASTKDGAYDKALFCQLLTLCIISVSKFEVVCYKTGFNFKISNIGWAANHDFLFVKSKASILQFFAPVSASVSMISSINLCIEQFSSLQCAAFLDNLSASRLRLALPLMCLAMIGIRLTFARKLDILALVLNFPFLVKLMASCTGLLSVHTIVGCSLSLKMSYSLLIATAIARASSSHGDHLLHLFGSRVE